MSECTEPIKLCCPKCGQPTVVISYKIKKNMHGIMEYKNEYHDDRMYMAGSAVHKARIRCDSCGHYACIKWMD